MSTTRRPVAFVVAVAVLFGTLLVPQNLLAAAPPTLSLPTPLGETWKVIQGYNCGTHTDYDENAFDIVNANGRTRGAPVRAAADGTVWWFGGRNNTVILDHNNGYYTMYSHMDTLEPLSKGQFVTQGTLLGAAGSAGLSPDNAHLHFEMFRGEGIAASNRSGVPLAFQEGYNFPDSETCNQYMGARLTATGRQADTTPPSTPELADAGAGQNQIVRWTAATDADSGVQGYQVYVGTDAEGTGEWFVAGTEVALPTVEPGRYFVRVRALDQAGNASPWVTLLEVEL